MTRWLAFHFNLRPTTALVKKKYESVNKYYSCRLENNILLHYHIFKEAEPPTTPKVS